MKKIKIILSFWVIACLLSPFNSTGQTITSVQFGKQFNGVPDTRDAVIYQVNMRTFSKDGNFKGVISRLDSIKALGVNLIYLMPIYPVGILKSSNSPYCVSDYQAINKEFGTIDDLRTLVKGAHDRDMAVILDWVPNHTSFDHPWTKNKSWYLQDSTGNIISPIGTGWNDVAQLNYKNKDMRAEMIQSMKYWVLTANIDGFRCDYADGQPFDFWQEAISTLRAIPKHKLIFLAEGKRSDHYKEGFDYTFGFTFFEHLVDIYKKNRSVKSIDSLNTSDYKNAANGQQIVRYITNHDVNSSEGTPLDLFGQFKGSIAAFTVVSYMKSVPMIYNGQEVGTPYRLTFPFTTTKIDWNINPEQTAVYKKIIAFRNGSKAIRRGALTSYSTDDICAFTKEKDAEKVLVLSNMRNKQISYSVPKVLLNTVWKDAFTGNTYKMNTILALAPYTCLVLKN